MITELNELDLKLYKGKEFLNSEKRCSKFLDETQLINLAIQIEHMERYAEVLQERINYDSEKK